MHSRLLANHLGARKDPEFVSLLHGDDHLIARIGEMGFIPVG